MRASALMDLGSVSVADLNVILIPDPLLTVMGAQRDYRRWIWDQVLLAVGYKPL